MWYWGGLIPIDNFLGHYIKGMKKNLLTDPVTSYFQLEEEPLVDSLQL